MSVKKIDVTSPGAWDELVDSPGMTVFHLAAVMSGAGELNFDLCMDVNLFAFKVGPEICNKFLLVYTSAEQLMCTRVG